MMRKLAVAVLLAVAGTASASWTGKLVWSVYPGWMPVPYADFKGYMKEEADKAGIGIEVSELKYAPSVEQFVAGNFDACVMTNMEAYDWPAAAGIDVTVLLPTDYSDGNDGVIVKKGVDPLKLPRGSHVVMGDGTVSRYLFNKWLENIGRPRDYFTIANVIDENLIPTTFLEGEHPLCVTWNPHLMNILQDPRVNPVPVFTSAEIPGHIMDLLVVKTAVLREHPEFGTALVNALYKAMADMSDRRTKGPTLSWMARKAATNTLDEFTSQLRTTRMFYTPTEAYEWMNSSSYDLMDEMRKFCAETGLLKDVKNPDEIAIEFTANGVTRVLGKPDNLKLRFTDVYMRATAANIAAGK